MLSLSLSWSFIVFFSPLMHDEHHWWTQSLLKSRLKRKKNILLLVCFTCLFVILYWFPFKHYSFSKRHIQIGETGYSCSSCFCHFSLFLLIRGPTLLIPCMWQMLLIFLSKLIFVVLYLNHGHQVFYCLVISFSTKIHSFSVWWWREKYGQLGFLFTLILNFITHIIA